MQQVAMVEERLDCSWHSVFRSWMSFLAAILSQANYLRDLVPLTLEQKGDFHKYYRTLLYQYSFFHILNSTYLPPYLGYLSYILMPNIYYTAVLLVQIPHLVQSIALSSLNEVGNNLLNIIRFVATIHFLPFTFFYKYRCLNG
jgi:hypothetical protein